MATTPPYCTRERVRKAAGFDDPNTGRVDDAIRAAAEIVEGDALRKFYPTTGTRVFDWPPPNMSRSWRLWFEHHDCISIASLTIAGTAASVGDFNLEPANDGPPYTHLEVDLSSTAAFSASTTHQQAISIVGVWGYNDNTTTAGTLGAAISDTTSTTLDATNDGLFDVWDLLTVGSERMLVTDGEFVDTGIDTNGTMDAKVNDTDVPVADSSSFIVGERIRLNDEEQIITGLTPTSLLVDRAVQGDSKHIAAHASGDDIYARRRFTVERGATGSTAATHSISAAITKQVYPPLISQWATAEAIVQLAQQSADYARTAGQGEGERETIGRGRVDLRERALTTHGRRFRIGAI